MGKLEKVEEAKVGENDKLRAQIEELTKQVETLEKVEGGMGGGDTDGGTAPLATAPLATAPLATAPLATAPLATAPLATAPCLGIIRVDYDYEAAPGDIDSHESYAYDVFYRVVPGLTFDVCKGIIHKIKRGEDPLTGQLLEDFREAIRYLDEEKEVFGSTRLAPRTGLASTH